MRNYPVWLSWAFVAVCYICGQQAGGTHQTSKSADQAEITNMLDAKIKEEWEAIKNKNQKAYGELLTDDYVAVESDGNGERYKWKALSELEQSMVADYTLSFLKVSTLCPDMALVRYEVFIRFPPKSTVKFEKILVGEIWVKRDERWKALHYQETRVK